MTETLFIPAAGSLDSITVFWQNLGPQQGQVTIICWGCAWTAYFGGMPEETIQQFFAKAGTDYMINKLGCTQWLKQTKHHEKYLTRLCIAVKSALSSKSNS